jgi:hypothetical protein
MNLSHKAGAALGRSPQRQSRGGANLNLIARSRRWCPRIGPIMREMMILHNQGSPKLMKADHVTYSF